MEFNIGRYLEKFASIGLKESILKEEIIAAVKIEIGVELAKKDITFRNGEVFLTGTPAFKSQLMVKKTALMKRLSDVLAANRKSSLR